jgi:hypothetical protein
MNVRKPQTKVFSAALAGVSCLVGMVILASPALAAPFTDGGFETPDIAAPYVTVAAGGTIGPWTVTGTSVDLLDSAGGFAVTEGAQAIDLAGSPGPGGVQQAFDTVAGTTYQVQYDVGSRCAGIPTDVRAFINAAMVDSATFPTTAPFATRSFTFTAAGPSTTLLIDTTAAGNCGPTLDNVRLTPITTVAASPASQCTGASGHRVQFRKVSNTLTSLATADAAMSTDPSAPTVLARATDNGVPTINYSDNGYTVPGGSQAPFAPLRDIQTPPLTPVSGTFLAGDDPNTVMRSSGYISVPTAGTWTFTVHADDGNRLAIGSPPQVVIVTDAVFVGDVTTSAPVVFAAPGCYHYTLEHVNGAGPSSVSLSATGPGQPTPTLVGLGLLPVFQGVDNPTTCKITAVRRAPASTDGVHDDMDVTITDLDTIGAIFNVLITNGTAAIVSPGLTPGVSTSIVLRATKTTQGQPTTWSFGVSDWNGNVKLCQ